MIGIILSQEQRFQQPSQNSQNTVQIYRFFVIQPFCPIVTNIRSPTSKFSHQRPQIYISFKAQHHNVTNITMSSTFITYHNEQHL